MATIKSHTDLEQSRKLAEILPIESADMAWCNNSIKGVNYTDEYSVNLYTVKEMQECFDETLNGWDKYWKLIPCWSLAALLNAIPQDRILLNRFEGKWYSSAFYWDESENAKEIEVEEQHTPIEACYKLILKLHKLKLL